MRASVVAAAVGLLLAWAVVCYHFNVPPSLRPKATHDTAAARPSAYGPIDAEFDWCEENFALSRFVCEPLNTLTSAAYPALAVYAWRRHSSHASLWLRVLLLIAGVMGVGSVAFHASLTYPTQLLDELPMFALATLAAAVLFARGNQGHAAQAGAVGLASVIAAVLLLSPRESTVHSSFRGVMVCTFAASFVYVLTAGSIAAKEVDRVRVGADGMCLFRASFGLFLTAILAWICDVLCCGSLRALPLGLPYPHLHALGWHLGTAAGLYFLFCLLLLHQHAVRGGSAELLVEWLGPGGVWPVVEARTHTRKEG